MANLQLEDLPHYTYDDYVQWEGRWELIHGVAHARLRPPTLPTKSSDSTFPANLNVHWSIAKNAMRCCPWTGK